MNHIRHFSDDWSSGLSFHSFFSARHTCKSSRTKQDVRARGRPLHRRRFPMALSLRSPASPLELCAAESAGVLGDVEARGGEASLDGAAATAPVADAGRRVWRRGAWDGIGDVEGDAGAVASHLSFAGAEFAAGGHARGGAGPLGGRGVVPGEVGMVAEFPWPDEVSDGEDGTEDNA